MNYNNEYERNRYRRGGQRRGFEDEGGRSGEESSSRGDRWPNEGEEYSSGLGNRYASENRRGQYADQQEYEGGSREGYEGGNWGDDRSRQGSRGRWSSPRSGSEQYRSRGSSYGQDEGYGSPGRPSGRGDGGSRQYGNEDDSWGANWYDQGMRSNQGSRYYQSGGGYDRGEDRGGSWSRGSARNYDDMSRGYGGGYSSSSGASGGSSGGFSAMGYGGAGSSIGRGSSSGYGPQLGDSVAERSRGGQHFGKGPKGWQRSDDRLREEVNEALARDSEIDASDIEVKVDNGEVTLTGTVTERRAKRMAEECAESVFGVKDVQNQIKIKKDDDSQWDSSATKNRDREGRITGEARTGSESNESKQKNKTGAAAGVTG